MIKDAIKKIVDKQDLSYNEAYQVMNEIMSGNTTAVENAAYLAALSTKSSGMETIDEISGSASAMRQHALKLEHGMDVIDIVGTGGDNSHSINVSTTAAFIASAAGLKVAKHGNRAASSNSGTADCLEAMGVNIHQPPRTAIKGLKDIGIAFLFAQHYHTSMKYVGSIRKELGIRTVFNILGPLTNPAYPTHMLLGVYGEHLIEPVGRVLPKLGVKRGVVVHGTDIMDEISISAKTKIYEFDTIKNTSRLYEISPEDFGIARAEREEILGGTPEENAKVTLGILAGDITDARRDIVLLNAGASIYIGGLASSIKDGIAIAREMIASGKALKRVDEFVKYSNNQ